MDVFTAASHHDILVLVIQIAVLLFTARALGEVAQRLGQPSVVGEILAGIILGPSLLSSLVPALGAWIVPQTEVQGYLLEVVSLIGAVFLLLITGLETDLALIRRHARTAIGVSFGGIAVSFLVGFLIGQSLPAFLLAAEDDRLVFSLFVAIAMSISSIPVIAKVLMDLDLMRRDVGQTTIAAAMSDDTVGWILLSVVIGLAGGQAITAGSVLQTVVSVLAFMVISFTLGRWLVKKLLDFVQDEVISRDSLLSLVVILTFTWGAISQALNIEVVLGAFVMGILIGQMPRLPEAVHHQLENVALGIFSPIFFAVAGLKVNILNLLDPQLLLITLLVIVLATISKIVGNYAGARLIGGRDHWTALSFGAGLNARGAMGIIVATIGLNLGILVQDAFSILVLMAIATSLMAPPALRWALKRVEPGEEELQRLRREELAAQSLVANIHRVLLPVRRRENGESAVQTIEAHVLEKIGTKTELSVTLLNVAAAGNREEGVQFLSELAPLFSQKEVVARVVEGSQPDRAILNEAEKDYDLLVFGATEHRKGENILFTPLVDHLVRLSPSPTLVVQGERVQPGWNPSRILIPTNGTAAARNAAELGFALASGEDDEILILHAVQENTNNYFIDASGEMFEKQLDAGRHIVNELRELGDAAGVRTDVSIRPGIDPESVILETARDYNMDLIILGTSVRSGTSRLFLGPRVERILTNAPCPVIVFNT